MGLLAPTIVFLVSKEVFIRYMRANRDPGRPQPLSSSVASIAWRSRFKLGIGLDILFSLAFTVVPDVLIEKQELRACVDLKGRRRFRLAKPQNHLTFSQRARDHGCKITVRRYEAHHIDILGIHDIHCINHECDIRCIFPLDRSYC